MNLPAQFTTSEHVSLADGAAQAGQRWRRIARLGLMCLVVVWAGWAGTTSASAQIGNNPLRPGDNQLKFEQLSGPNDDPLIWRVLMNDYMYRRFVTTGLAAAAAVGPLRPNTWLGLRGRYFPMQYIGRRGNMHELKLVQWMGSATPAATPASPPDAGGCCAWRHPNGTPPCSGHPAAACQGELRGTFYPGYSCKITSECSP